MSFERQTNFASRRPQPLWPIVGLLWLAAGLLLVTCGWMAIDHQANRAEAGQLAGHIERLREQATQDIRDAVAVPSLTEINSQLVRVGYYNALTGQRSLPVTALLAQLETAMPNDVRLSKLAYDVGSGQLIVSIQSETDKHLPVALKSLEDSFAAVILKRQLRLQQGGRNLLQFDVEARVP